MTAADVTLAVEARQGLNARDFCTALDITLPVIRKLSEGRSFWLKWGMGVLIRALEGYRKETCG